MVCRAAKKDKSPCLVRAAQGSEYCYFHNPLIREEERQNFRSRGGRANVSDAKLSLPAVHFTQPQDVVLLLEDVINGVRSGNMDLKTANCFGYLAGQLSKALEISELGARIEALEKTLAQR